MQTLNVLDGVAQDVHLGHLLVAGGRGHHHPQPLEPVVHGLNAVALPRVPLHHLDVLGGLDRVAVHGVQHYQLGFGSHGLL